MKADLTDRRFIAPPDEYFNSAHASTLVINPDSSLVFACFGGTHEGHNDVGIYIFRLNADGYDCRHVKTVKISQEPHWNPVLYRRRDNSVVCYFKVGASPREWRTYFVLSDNGGKDWSDARPAGGVPDGGPVKNKPLLMSNGVLAAPFSRETATDWTVIPSLSYDDGLTFTESAPPGYINKPAVTGRSGVIQPALWEDADGVHMLLRSTWGRLWRSDSSDFGVHWSDIYQTDIPNNNSGIDAARTGSGIIALVMNPVSGDFAARTPLTLSLSDDGGRSFVTALTLEDAPGEYSYPAVIADGGALHIAYTYNRKTIAYAKAVIY